MSKYSSIKVGDKESIFHKVTEADIERFVELSGDNNRLHVDKAFAEATPLKERVVHGMIGASFISTVIGTKIPGDGALWYSQSLEFLMPVRIGDELEIIATVVGKAARLNSIDLKTEIFNQKRQIVTSGFAKVKIIEQTPPKPNLDTVPASHDKIAVVIGSTGGIGLAVSRKLANEGYHLVLHYNSNEKAANELKEELEVHTEKKVITCRANLLEEGEIDKMFREIARYFEHITAIINTATTPFGNAPLDRIEWADILTQLEINIKANFYITKAALPFMQSLNYGKIVFITSLATEQIPIENLHYVTAKSALNGFTRSLAADLAPRGIRVNLVSPGMTDTSLVADVSEKVKLTTAARTPLRRIADPADIANAIFYLASESSDFVTGETLRVNGGMVMI